MRFTGLTLTNFTCHVDTSVSFTPGVTVIHGVNGSGKSSLLDASFFALYGADTLDGATLDEIITAGADNTSVLLSFTHAGTAYEIERTIKLRGNRAQTTTCELRGPDTLISGARDVQSAITEMLRMDADAFLNCAYVRQGEVNKLIHASPRERQNMIDELLQLGILEEYRDRATEARRALASLSDELTGQIDAIADQINSKEKDSLLERRTDTESKLNAVTNAIDELDERIDSIRSQKETAERILEESAERREELESLEASITSLREDIDSHTSDREDITTDLTERIDERSDIEAELEKLAAEISIEPTVDAVEDALDAVRSQDEELREAIESTKIEIERAQNEANQASERATDLELRIQDFRESIESVQATLESSTETLAERREQLTALEAEYETVTTTTEEAPFDCSNIDSLIRDRESERTTLREKASELETKLSHHTDEIAETESLIEDGKCPTCQQPIESAPPVAELDTLRTHVKEIEDQLATVQDEQEAVAERLTELRELRETHHRQQQLAEQIATLRDLVDEKAKTQQSQREEIDRLETNIADAQDELAACESTLEDTEQQIETHRKTIGRLNDERSTRKERKETLETIRSYLDRSQTLADKIEQIRERRDAIDRLLDEKRDRISEKRERIQTLREAVDSERIAEAQNVVETATSSLDDLRATRQEQVTARESLHETLGRIQNEIDEINSLETRREELEERAAAIAAAHEDIESLETLYGTLRGDLREQNIAALERFLNDTFSLIYQNDAYDRIELDREYRFTIYQKDGEPLDPEQLSGGERALFNLSLRCAIYRLLSEAIQGSAPLPPLILDEPTVYLDSGHVGRLVDLIDAMRSVGVEQIVIVTHDTELLHAADTLLHVEKDSTTNRSSVQSDSVVPPEISIE